MHRPNHEILSLAFAIFFGIALPSAAAEEFLKNTYVIPNIARVTLQHPNSWRVKVDEIVLPDGRKAPGSIEITNTDGPRFWVTVSVLPVGGDARPDLREKIISGLKERFFMRAKQPNPKYREATLPVHEVNTRYGPAYYYSATLKEADQGIYTSIFDVQSSWVGGLVLVYGRVAPGREEVLPITIEMLKTAKYEK